MPGLSEHEALELFARCVAEIVGPRTEACRDMMKAVQSGQMVDLMLAQSSFDALSPEVRRRISDRVQDLVAQHLSGAIDATDPDAMRHGSR
ncbi:hypothetical protein BAL199_20080 [alpha proteobacterium BAL199]|jgi:hypothetical protein|nr:hypothetical protein BAL199_20080 [alpha proteobacterium BAL199]